jgi:hypothetical protein
MVAAPAPFGNGYVFSQAEASGGSAGGEFEIQNSTIRQLFNCLIVELSE